MGFGTVGLGQTESADWEEQNDRIFSNRYHWQSEWRTSFAQIFSFFFFSCNSTLLPRLPKGRGIAGIFLSTKPAYVLCAAGKFSGLKFPQMWCLWCLFVLSFFPWDVLDEILNLIESVSEGFPTYSCTTKSVQSANSPSLDLFGRKSKARTTTALDTTRTTQLPNKLRVLKPRSPRHFPGPKVAGATNDWCINFKHRHSREIL